MEMYKLPEVHVYLQKNLLLKISYVNCLFSQILKLQTAAQHSLCAGITKNV